MKKSVFYIAALTAVLAVACQKEKDPSAESVNPPAKEGLVFKATTPSIVTKTSISDGEGDTKVVNWVANDQIEIWWADDAHVTYATDQAGSECEFTPVSDPVGYVNRYYASYPASAVTALDTEGGALSVSVPAEQGYGKAVDGTFAKANIAVATAWRVYVGLAFKNVTALVKFNVTGSDYTKAVFKGAKGETVAGTVSVTFDAENENEPVFGEVTDGSTEVEIALNGTGEYYFSVLPQTFEGGFSITLYKGETAEVPAFVRNSKEMSRSTLWDLGTLDGVGVKDFFVTPAGSGKKSGKSWDNAFGVDELKAFLEQPVDGEGAQLNEADYYKAEILDGATIHMAAGDYYLAGVAQGAVKVEFTGYPKQVAITFKGGYPADKTGTDVSGWTMPTAASDAPTNCTAFTGNEEAGIFMFGNQTNVTFQGITFKDANLGGIKNDGAINVSAGSSGDAALSLSYCRFIDNKNTSAKSGAGIILYKAASSIDHCYFSGNYARNGSAIILDSGAGAVTISNSLFEKNSTHKTSGALQNGGKTLTVTDCTFDGNQVKEDGDPYGGGAFHANGSGSVSTFTRCTFSNNSCKMGGAVSVETAQATFTDCSFTGNTATLGSKKAAGDGTSDVQASYAGGAIILHNGNSICTLNNCTFTNNTAPNGNGGAIASKNSASTLNVNAGTSFSNCSAYGPGGAIFLLKSNLNITGTSDSKVTFSGCKTLATGNQHGNGGAIWLGDNSSTSIAYATFTNNEAGQEDGSTVEYSNGGAIRAKKVASLQVGNSEFSGCRGRNGNCISLELGSNAVKFTDCNFHDNIGRSGASKNGTGGNFHGGVAQLGAGTVDFERCAFTDNVAYHGSGALHINGAAATANCKNCTFTHNTALNGNGGCVNIESSGVLNLEGCTFTGNSTTASSSTRRDGGVFCVSPGDTKDPTKNINSVLRAKSCTFSGNSIIGNGAKNPYGGILRCGFIADISFTDCVFDGNGSTIVYSGGCFSINQDAVLKLDNCLFKNNVARTRGAAIQAGGNALVYMNNVSFYNNTTTGSGGWGVNAHCGNANVCMNNVTSIGNHCTNVSPGNCISFNGDGGWLVVNSTIIDSTPTGVVRVGGNNRVSVFCNNVLINTNTANNTWNMKATTNFSSKGHNVISADGTYNNAAPDAADLLAQTSLPSGAYSEQWSVAPHYAVYTWTGSLSGFSAATESDVTAAIEAYTETDSVHTDITSIGADFKAWLESLETGSYSTDGRGVTRTGAWWPGAYQNN